MYPSLELKIVVGQKRFTSRHRTAGGEEEERHKVTDFMRSRFIEKYIDEDRHIWRLGVDGRLLAV
jgi:hypothetical protein